MFRNKIPSNKFISLWSVAVSWSVLSDTRSQGITEATLTEEKHLNNTFGGEICPTYCSTFQYETAIGLNNHNTALTQNNNLG